MMIDDRKLKLAILQSLDRSRGVMLPEAALLQEVRDTAPVVPTHTEFISTLSMLEAQGYLTGITPELGGRPKWRITDKGRAALANS